MGNNLNSECQDIGADHNSGLRRLEPLKFHEVYSRGVFVSPNRLVLRCLDQGSGVAFSERPIHPEEIICLKVVMFHKGVLRFGLTTHDPGNLTQEALTVAFNRCSKSVFMKEVSNGTMQKNNLVFFKLTHGGQVVYGWQRKDKEKDKGVLISDVPLHIPVWAIFDISGRNLALKLEGDTLHILKAKSFRTMQRMKRAKSLEVLSPVDDMREISTNLSNSHDTDLSLQEQSTSNFSRRRSFSFLNISQRSLHRQQSSNTTNIESNQDLRSPEINQSTTKSNRQQGRKFSKPQQQKQFEERIPMYFHLKIGRSITLCCERTVAFNRTGKSNGYVFTRRPLWIDEKFVIGIVKVNGQSGASLGFGLTVCDPKVVTEFPDEADEFIDREEYWVFVKEASTGLKEGDELAFMINKRGEVGISKNQSPFRTLMHVDPLMMYYVFFDVTGSLEKISSLGTVLHHKQSVGSLIDPGSDVPRSKAPRPPIARHPSPDFRPNIPLDQLDTATTTAQNNFTSPREAQVTTTSSVRIDSSQFDLFADPPPLLTPPLIPMPSNSKPQVLQGKGRPPREIRKTSLPATPSQIIQIREHHRNINIDNDSTTKILSTQEVESLLKVLDTTKIPTLKLTPEVTEPHECSICLEKTPDCVLYTCGHMCLCFECGQSILRSANPLCPLCRKPIADVIKIYKS